MTVHHHVYYFITAVIISYDQITVSGWSTHAEEEEEGNIAHPSSLFNGLYCCASINLCCLLMLSLFSRDLRVTQKLARQFRCYFMLFSFSKIRNIEFPLVLSYSLIPFFDVPFSKWVLLHRSLPVMIKRGHFSCKAEGLTRSHLQIIALRWEIYICSFVASILSVLPQACARSSVWIEERQEKSVLQCTRSSCVLQSGARVTDPNSCRAARTYVTDVALVLFGDASSVYNKALYAWSDGEGWHPPNSETGVGFERWGRNWKQRPLMQTLSTTAAFSAPI